MRAMNQQDPRLPRFAQVSSFGVVCALMSALWLGPAGGVADASGERTLQVFAAASLSAPFTELGALFEARHPGWRVRINASGSPQLVSQLEMGARADLLAPADEVWMARADSLGLIEGSPRTFAHNRLVVVAARGRGARVRRLQDLAGPGVKLVLGAEAVPVGRYSRELLRRLSRMPGFGAQFESRVLAHVVSQEENVRAVLGKVQLGEADAGIVYRSDVADGGSERLLLLEVPDEAHVIASYPIAVVRGAREPEAAREFVVLVTSAEGRRVLERHGFTTPSDVRE